MEGVGREGEGKVNSAALHCNTLVSQSLQVYTFARIFTVFQGLIRVYGITILFTGFRASFVGSLWLVFSLFL